MSRENRKIKRTRIAGLPLIRAIEKKMNLRSILSQYIKSNGNEIIPIADTLMLMIYNITLGRQPLYELSAWVNNLDVSIHGLHDYELLSLNDDRFARALDSLYKADRASLLTSIVVDMIKNFSIDLSRIHNDSTTVKACGKMNGITSTGFHLAQGKSKDHRPDLKQLLFTLSISSDGAVPIHFKTYPGNRTDDTTHIETWDTLRSIIGNPNFMYVADCKVCTAKQLNHIVGSGGRVITILPETWKETKEFKETLRNEDISKERIWIRCTPNSSHSTEYFSSYSGEYFTAKKGYRIYWIHSSEKKKLDSDRREKRNHKAEQMLSDISIHINKYKLKTYVDISKAVYSVLKKYKASKFYKINIEEIVTQKKIQIGRGRPGPNTQYRIQENIMYSLEWKKDTKALRKEKKIDGIFPLLTTDSTLTAKKVLKIYKYQPRLEKRFTQFKSVHEAAPLFFKRIDRIESIMFLFFVSLIIQALIERTVRGNMAKQNIKSIDVYPELRRSSYPTTSKILEKFDEISVYRLLENNKIIDYYRDDLDKTHKQIIQLMEIQEDEY